MRRMTVIAFAVRDIAERWNVRVPVNSVITRAVVLSLCLVTLLSSWKLATLYGLEDVLSESNRFKFCSD
ncbi:hypothetical protein Q1695_010803 [Nippostrongylus brasiliensis]|nr:hypothetical protein Q1695_010803 [Nippostrongylus brasiliensis]